MLSTILASLVVYGHFILMKKNLTLKINVSVFRLICIHVLIFPVMQTIHVANITFARVDMTAKTGSVNPARMPVACVASFRCATRTLTWFPFRCSHSCARWRTTSSKRDISTRSNLWNGGVPREALFGFLQN